MRVPKTILAPLTQLDSEYPPSKRKADGSIPSWGAN
jgi:hypothetical protein